MVDCGDPLINSRCYYSGASSPSCSIRISVTVYLYDDVVSTWLWLESLRCTYLCRRRGVRIARIQRCLSMETMLHVPFITVAV